MSDNFESAFDLKGWSSEELISHIRIICELIQIAETTDNWNDWKMWDDEFEVAKTELMKRLDEKDA